MVSFFPVRKRSDKPVSKDYRHRLIWLANGKTITAIQGMLLMFEILELVDGRRGNRFAGNDDLKKSSGKNKCAVQFLKRVNCPDAGNKSRYRSEKYTADIFL